MIPVALRDAHEEDRFGGKAVQLGQALRAGFPVPPGRALSVRLVEALFGGHQDAHAAVSLLHAELGGGRVAARSSAVGEDSAGASFAGQHLTRLNVASAADLASAVIDVRNSGHSEAALAYRSKLGIEAPPRMGVVVQVMIQAECAGVMFTRNPIDGKDERIIEAAWGLGEVVVSGLVTPDSYRMARGGAILERRAGEKDIEIRADADGDNREVDVAPDRVHALCLDDARLQALEELASSCERHFEGAHDIEWAFAGPELYLLQRRAITR